MAHPPRIPVWLSWETPVVYFVTFCVKNRHPALASPEVWRAFSAACARLQKWEVEAAVMMPDHVHILARPTLSRDEAVGNLTGSLKRWTRQPFGQTWEWQEGCFDRLLRNDESAHGKWDYIRENPVRAGLVRRWDEWPYWFAAGDLP